MRMRVIRVVTSQAKRCENDREAELNPMLRRERLSERQCQILDGLAAGRSNSVIAGELGITLDGVKWHVSELLGETGCTNRLELAAWWQREAPRRAAPAFLPVRILSHTTVGAAVRIAVVFAISAAIAAGIVVAASRRSSTGSLLVAAGTMGKLAYVQDGDIWVKALPDGASEQITHHTGDQDAYSWLRWSPSGQWLGFFAGTQPGVMRADGSDPRNLEHDAVWAPSDDRFAMVDSTNAIVTENADGAGRRTVVPPPSADEGVTTDVGGLSWSPDGRWIAYGERKRQSGATPPYIAARLWLVSADGGAPTNVYDAGDPPQDDVGLLGWSGDGHALLFTIDPFFSRSAPADGLPLHILSGLTGGRPGTRAIAPSPPTMLLWDELWQPLPGRNLVAITDGAGRETWRNKRIAVVSWASGTVTDLTDAGMAAMQPAWSPDGEHIAYAAAPDAGLSVAGGDPARAAMAFRKIWVMDADGSNQRQLTDDPAYRDERPLWSADGDHILFVRLDADDHVSLWLIPSAGGTPKQVVQTLSPVEIKGGTVWFGYYGYTAWDNHFDWWRR